jgi:predicted Zn-dependent peptidase
MRALSNPPVQTSTLANGLRVVTVALPHLHTTTMVVYVKVGARFESAHTSGLSHFVEHMLFRGTERYPSSLAMNTAVESLGSTLHAETGRDYSLYQMSFEPTLIESGVELFGEVLGRPRFADIELERSLILEEMNEDYDEEDVEINVDEIARGLIFGEHPLGLRIIGTRDNIRRFSDEDVRRHFARYYGANNLLLCVAGPVEHAAVAAAARDLEHLSSGEAAIYEPAHFDQKAAKYKYVRDAGSQCSISILWRGVSELDPDYVAFVALLRAIDDGMSTPLHYQLCDQKGLAYSVHAGIEPLADVVLLEVSGQTAQAKVPDLVSGILELIAGFRDRPVTAAELAKIKRRYRYDLLASIDDAGAMAGWFGGTALYYPPPSLEGRLAQMEAVTAEDIMAVARKVVQPDRLAVSIVGPLSRARQGDVKAAVLGWR